jgi:phage terminase large subunit GpA-like protein
VYGKAGPESADMACPHCGGVWTDAERARNSREAELRGGGWKAGSPFTGIAGFYVSDLMSSSPGASLPHLVEKYLQAKHREAAGDLTGLIEFANNQLGQSYKYASPAPKVEELEARAEGYDELTVPWGGLRITIGVDVQSDRVALLVVAWGRGEESWRVYWGDIYGNPVDRDDEVWRELERMIFRPFRHAGGAEMFAKRISIDSGDGNTSDAVYWFCRKHRNRGVIATKGVEGGEIYRVPKPIDPGRKLSKAARYGLQVYLVGTEKAKDLIIGFGERGGRLRLSEKNDAGDIVTGSGQGRMHWYRGIRGDYFPGVTAEVKGPMRGRPRTKLIWQCKAGVRNEPLDCEVGALHAARALRLNVYTEAQWMALETELRQPDLVGRAQENEAPAGSSGIDAEAEAADVALEAATETIADVPARAPKSTQRADPRAGQIGRPVGGGEPEPFM